LKPFHESVEAVVSTATAREASIALAATESVVATPFCPLEPEQEAIKSPEASTPARAKVIFFFISVVGLTL